MNITERSCYLLVSGSPRSGTTLLANVLNTHPQVACLHEYRLDDLIKNVEAFRKFEEDEILRVKPDYRPAIKISGSIHDFMLSRFEFVSDKAGDVMLTYREAHFEEMFKAFFKCVSGKADLLVYGDKMPDIRYLQNNTADIRRRLGSLKCLFIVRKPEDVIQSSMRRTMMSLRGLDLLWTPRTLKEAIFEWVENWEYIVQEVRRNPENVYVLKYESLIESFPEESAKLASYLGVADEFVNVTVSTPDHLVDFRLTEEQILEIQEHLGDLAAKWDDLSASAIIASARQTTFYFGAERLFKIRAHDTSKLILRKGFSALENWGVWTCEATAEICMRLDQEISSVELSVKPFFKRASFRICVNGGAETTFEIKKGVLQRFTDILVPIVPPSATIKLQICLTKIKSSGDPPYTDFRKLGIGLRRLSLESG